MIEFEGKQSLVSYLPSKPAWGTGVYLKSTDILFTSEEMQKPDEASKVPSEYPGWVLERLGGDRKKQ